MCHAYPTETASNPPRSGVFLDVTDSSALLHSGRDGGPTVGSGENLNEHILGGRWPLADERLEMLEEAIEVIRLMWTGDEVAGRALCPPFCRLDRGRTLLRTIR